MIISSPVAKALSLALAVVFVVGGMRLAQPAMVIEIQGSAAASDAKLGTSFSDLSVGTLTTQPVREVIEPQTAPDTVEAIKPVFDSSSPPTKTITQSVQDHRTLSSSLPEINPVSPTKTTAAAQLTRPTQATDVIAPAAVLNPITPSPAPAKLVAPAPIPLAPMAPTAEPLAPLGAPLSQTQTVTPSRPAPVAPTETIVAQEPQSTAPPKSARPQRRDPAKAAKIAAARPKPKVVQKSAKPTKKKASSAPGNATRNTTQGAANGTSQTSKAKAQSDTKRASAASGNAAISNYPGQVMRRINRIPRPRVSARGTTVVAFSVSSGGGLARVAVARSSGSSALDRAAVDMIRRAAPFPAPPRGAQRQFSIKIKGR